MKPLAVDGWRLAGETKTAETAATFRFRDFSCERAFCEVFVAMPLPTANRQPTTDSRMQVPR